MLLDRLALTLLPGGVTTTLAPPPGPGKERTVTSQGHPRTTFRRALERGNLLLAETTAREVGHVDLREALELAALIAHHDPRVRGRRASARWLRRWLEERPRATIDEVVMIAGLLAALGGAEHSSALATLRHVAGRAKLRT